MYMINDSWSVSRFSICKKEIDKIHKNVNNLNIFTTLISLIQDNANYIRDDLVTILWKQTETIP